MPHTAPPKMAAHIHVLTNQSIANHRLYISDSKSRADFFNTSSKTRQNVLHRGVKKHGRHNFDLFISFDHNNS